MFDLDRSNWLGVRPALDGHKQVFATVGLPAFRTVHTQGIKWAADSATSDVKFSQRLDAILALATCLRA